MSNGGIFCHNNPWVIIGEFVNGRPQDGFEHYKKIAPSYVDKIDELHRTEPYIYSQMIAGKEAKNFGQAKNSWLTGTAAWNLVVLTRYICGIRPEYKGLLIEPRLPEHIKTAEITREYRGVNYHIKVINKKNDGKVTLTSDSAQIDGLVASAKTGAKEVFVTATIE